VKKIDYISGLIWILAATGCHCHCMLTYRDLTWSKKWGYQFRSGEGGALEFFGRVRGGAPEENGFSVI